MQDKGGEIVQGEEITLAGYAAVNEFGSADGRIPERSFLRSTVDGKRGAYADDLTRAAKKMIDVTIRRGPGAGIRQLENDLGLLGNRASGDVKTTIRTLREPANKPSTRRRKKSSNPLIDTGRMRQSISHKVDMDGGK